MAFYNGKDQFLLQNIIKGDKGDSAYIRYSFDDDGTDFTDTWIEGQRYMGVATAQEAPTDKSSYTWIELTKLMSIVQTTGDSESSVMSQKAVTDAINETLKKKEAIPLELGTFNSNGEVANNTRARSKAFLLKKGSRITSIANEEYSFLFVIYKTDSDGNYTGEIKTSWVTEYTYKGVDTYARIVVEMNPKTNFKDNPEITLNDKVYGDFIESRVDFLTEEFEKIANNPSDSNVEVVQELGDSETAVISQKVVTDAINETLKKKEAIPLELGTFNSNGEVANNTRARSQTLLLKKNTVLTSADNVVFVIYKTDSDGNYVGGIKTAWVTEYTYEGSNTNARIVAKTTDEANLSTNTEISLNDMVYQSYFESAVEKMSDEINKITDIVFVAVDGSDESGDGTRNYPYATFAKAISTGKQNIVASAGIYYERIFIDSPNNKALKISVNPYGEQYSTSKPDREKIVIDLGEPLTMSEGADGLLVCSYIANTDTYLYKVFIGKTINAITSTQKGGQYGANIWEEKDGINDIKLVPVLSLEQCKNTVGTFHYDGSTIYINPTISCAKYVLCEKSANKLELFNKLELEGLEFAHSYTSNLAISRCNSVIVRDCNFRHACTDNGLSMNFSNGTLYGCKAWKNYNDGFNFHYFGDTHLINCSGFYNYDDGVSHHDGCTGSINGGEWHHNGKGGVSSPTYGSIVNIYNVESHNNQYGIYAVAESTHPVRKALVSGCYIHNNDCGVRTSRVNLQGFNNIVIDNITEKNIVSGSWDNATVGSK